MEGLTEKEALSIDTEPLTVEASSVAADSTLLGLHGIFGCAIAAAPIFLDCEVDHVGDDLVEGDEECEGRHFDCLWEALKFEVVDID